MKRVRLCGTHGELREEQESGCSAGDGLYVFFVVAAVVARQHEVEDAHDAHQEQEADDAFSEQVAWRAARKYGKQNELRNATEQNIESLGLIYLWEVCPKYPMKYFCLTIR